MKEILFVSIIGYLMGNIQAAYLLGKTLKKVDIRTLGKGNAGASNAVESLGWKFGLAVALIDILKGVLSVVLVKVLFELSLDKQGAFLLYLNGYFAILGHIYPFFMNFKGGKGTATLVGILFGFHPLYGLIGLLVIISVTLISDNVILGTFALTAYVIFLTVIQGFGPLALLVTSLGAILSFSLHLPNYKRIFRQQETKLSDVLHGKKS